MHHYDGTVSVTCDAVSLTWGGPIQKGGIMSQRGLVGPQGSSALQRPVPQAERAPRQCPASPTPYSWGF